MGDGYYTAQEAAKILHYSRRTIWNRIHSGDIPAVQIAGGRKWLIPKEWVNNLIASKIVDASCRYRLCKQVTIGDHTEEAQPWCTLQEGWCEHKAGDCPVLKEAGLCSSI